MTTQSLFPDIVGQDTAKRKLQFFIEGYNASSVLPHIMFIAPKGCGKTMMAKALGKELKSRENLGKAKKFLEINCSTIKNVKQFFNQIIIPHVNHQECTILFDEASELPKDVTMMLLTALNPNKENRNTVSYDDYVVDFDFRRQSFMLATTEAQSIFHALMDRCDRIDLEEYSYGELAEIVNRILPDVTYELSVLDKVATVLRGNARQAQKMATNINSYLKHRGKTNFTVEDWKSLRYTLGILPLGINRIELQILNVLQQKKECSLTHLSAKTGLTKSCVQRDFEMYLQKHSLMEIGRGGRTLTQKGHKYLEDVKKYLKNEDSRKHKKTIRIKLPNEGN